MDNNVDNMIKSYYNPTNLLTGIIFGFIGIIMTGLSLFFYFLLSGMTNDTKCYVNGEAVKCPEHLNIMVGGPILIGAIIFLAIAFFLVFKLSLDKKKFERHISGEE